MNLRSALRLIVGIGYILCVVGSETRPIHVINLACQPSC